MKKIRNRILGLELIDWRNCDWLQHNSLKEIQKPNFEKLKNSLTRHHFIDAFKVWKDSSGKIWILDGRTRKLGMEELKRQGTPIEDKLPAEFINCKSKKEAAELVLIFNSVYSRITQEGIESHVDFYELLFDDFKDTVSIESLDLNRMFLGNDKTVEELNEIPEKPKEPISQRGDFFILDEKHKIFVGDSTDQVDVKKLMGKQKADMVFTDPPYNLSYGGITNKFKEKFIAGDGITSEEFYEFLDKFNKNIKDFSKDGIAIYEWIDWRQYPVLFFVMKKHFHIQQCIVWDKTYMRLGSHYRNQHEFLIAGFNEDINDTDSLYADIQEMLIYSRTGKKITTWNGGKSEANIWYLRTIPPQSYVHPTEKPIELSQRAILNSSNKGDMVLDLFLGSGSTLVGATESDRICYGMELDPIYMDVILKRYLTLYPDKKVICKNREFDFNKLMD